MRCAMCGQDNAPEASFCATCGAPLPATEPEQPSSVSQGPAATLLQQVQALRDEVARLSREVQVVSNRLSSLELLRHALEQLGGFQATPSRPTPIPPRTLAPGRPATAETVSQAPAISRPPPPPPV